MQAALLRLFKAIQVNRKDTDRTVSPFAEKTIPRGYLLHPAIEADEKLLKQIETICGIDPSKINAAFHKSWSVVKKTDEWILRTQQILHYLSTYGLESKGLYHDDLIYIPQETLQLPELKQNIPLIVIKALQPEDVLEKIVELGAGMALAPQTLQDLMEIIEYNAYPPDFVEAISSHELKAALMDYYQIMPSEPVEFLRYVISKLTDQTLLIKNDELIEKIKKSNGKFLDNLLKDAPRNLGSIFYRYKPLFLALKSISRQKLFFNQLRRKAREQHQPLPPDYLNSISALIKKATLDHKRLKLKIAKAPLFRKIRLAYALNHRLHCRNSIVYRVRNGRGWAEKFHWPKSFKQQTQEALDIVLDSIVNDLRPHLEGKTVYIPAFMHYTLPATEKQFTGNFPTGSSVSVEQDLIVGIHWINNQHRIDLDLSVIGETGKIGWDAQYRTKDKSVLFSGDVTSAPPPHGASELFYLEQGQSESRILFLNYYNFLKDNPVEAKLLVAREKPGKFKQNYLVDPHNVVASANISVSKKQNVLGLIRQVEGKMRIYFANTSIGNSISASGSEQGTQVRKYLVDSFIHALDLRDFLQKAGAIVVDEKTDEVCYDLSPMQLSKTSFLDLLQLKS